MNGDSKDVIDTVQVAIRIRPLVESELARGCATCLDTVPGEPQIQVKGLAFTYNHVFPPEVGQRRFYEAAVGNLVMQLFKGYNVTILAYGQTGSGKTYSMGTCYSGDNDDIHNAGVIPLAITDIFNFVDSHSDEYNFKVSVSFMELYQEQLYDLLSSKPRDQTVIDIREDHRGIVLPGLTEKKVNNTEETIGCLIRGSAGRATGATAMNAQSSRSHAIFTVQILQECKHDSNKTTTSKFHLVDLAGSERSKKTKATGNRFKEGVKINQGLLALGNVISALGDGTNRGYIGYRESKLTRLLQDSLGGNSMTLMVACVSPADYNLDETISTLRYADRARNIRNKPIVNQDAKGAEIIRLNNLVQQLRLQLLNQGGEIPQNCSSLVEELKKEKCKFASLTEKYDILVEKNKNLNNMLHQSLTEHTHMFEKALLAEASKDKIEKKLAEITEECNQTINNLKLCDKTDVSIKEDALRDMCEIRSKIVDIHSEHKQCGQHILQLIHDESADAKVEEGSNDDYNTLMTPGELDESGFNEKQETHTFEQVTRNNQLQDLVKSLALKISLAEKLSSNNNELNTYSETVKETEAKLNELEIERDDLVQQLKNTQKWKMDPKQADERHKKIHSLETEISNLKKKCQQQANLIKMKEKNELKITTLNNEIQQMKAAKVKLIRTMRAENDRFRNWKIQNERNLAKLTNQDRKRQNEMMRMENKHTKQQNVMKRKMEEAVAINKRLKEAMERQRLPQKQREMQVAGKAEAVQHWVEQELELMSSLVAAERTLEGLMEDRGALTAQLEELRSRDPAHTNIPMLQEDIALRSTQIADLQQKILASDQENKSKLRWDTVQSMVEAKCALKYLFEVAAESKREIHNSNYKHSQEDVQFQEIKIAHKNAVSKLNDYEHRLKSINYKHRKELSEVEKLFEEKICTLVQPLNNIENETDGSTLTKQLNQQIVIMQEAFEKAINSKTLLETENEILRQKVDENESKHQKVMKKAAKAPQVSKTIVNFTDDEEEYSDDDGKDPDWSKTPQPRRNTTKLRNFSNVMEESKVSVKRSSDGQTKCSCKGNCSLKLCSCRKLMVACGSRCKCNEVLCINKHSADPDNHSPNQNVTDSGSNSDKENTYSDILTPEIKDENLFKLPRVDNIENIGNMTNKMKKNKSFFYGDGKNDI